MSYSFSRTVAGALSLTLGGDIDLEVTPEIKGQLMSQSDDAVSIEIDARHVSYIDSSGISILVIALQTAKKKRIPFTISAASAELMRVIKLARLDTVLPVETETGPADPSAGVSTQNAGGATDAGAGKAVSDADLIADLAKPPSAEVSEEESQPPADAAETGGLGIKPGTFG